MPNEQGLKKNSAPTETTRTSTHGCSNLIQINDKSLIAVSPTRSSRLSFTDSATSAAANVYAIQAGFVHVWKILDFTGRVSTVGRLS